MHSKIFMLLIKFSQNCQKCESQSYRYNGMGIVIILFPFIITTVLQLSCYRWRNLGLEKLNFESEKIIHGKMKFSLHCPWHHLQGIVSTPTGPLFYFSRPCSLKFPSPLTIEAIYIFKSIASVMSLPICLPLSNTASFMWVPGSGVPLIILCCI